nr:uncharacterized protein LOC109192891 [Ipomoea trifida]
MDAAYPEVPVKMMNDFHAIDRQLYSILVFELQRDPKVSVYMVALWIWLEYNKIKNVVQKIVLLPIKSIDGLADEAVACLRCITDAMSSDATEILLTQNLIGKHLSLKFFHENRAKALCGIRMVVENVCVKVLEDLMKMANAERQLPSSVSEQQQEPKDKRKMFATFSNRNPVSKPELLGYFKKEFGEDIVESISMQVVKPNEKSLFAVIIFTSSAIVDLILKVDKGQIGCSLVSVVLIFPFLLRTD